MSLESLLDRHSRYRHNDTALIFEGQRFSWSELRTDVDALITGLADEGVGHGDHVALVLANCLEAIHLYWAAAKAGIVVVPLSPLLRGAGLSTLINDSDAIAIVTSTDMVHHLDAVVEQLDPATRDRRFVIDGAADGYRPFGDLYTAQATAVGATSIDDDDIYNIIYSSGTTGLPKGIVHTHRVRQAYCTGFATSYRISQDSVIIHSGSLVFNGAFLTLMPWFLTGCTFVLMPAFDATAMVDLMEQESTTHAMLVPSQIVQLLADQRFGERDLPAVEMICSVGAPLLIEHKLELIERFPNRCYELYGLTEGFVTILDRSDFMGKAGSVGVPPPLYEMRIVDDEGVDVPVGEVGEIVGRGPITMPGYYKQPDLTAQAIRDGWLFSGDLGRVDDDGYLYLVDRKKDLIISGGVNVYPKDIEEIVITHPEVRDVTVFGVPHPTWGEQPIAAVQAGPGADPGAILDWVNERVTARYQKLGEVVILDSFPLSVSGKTLRRTIKSDYLEGRE